MTMPVIPVPNPEDNPPAGAPAPTETVDVEKLQAELDKWKHFSRTNEEKFKASQAELDTIKQAQMSDTEKAIEAARNTGRSEAAQSYGKRLVDAQIEVAAATAGVEVPKNLKDFIDTKALLNEDGEPNTEAITTLVSSFKPKTPTNPFRQDLGIGAPSGAGNSEARDFSPEGFAKRLRGKSPF